MTDAGSPHGDADPGAGGLITVRQAPADSIGRLDIGATTITDAWSQLFDHHGVRNSFIRAIRAVGAGRTKLELFDALDEREIPRRLWTPFARVCRGDRREAWRLVAEVLPAFTDYPAATTEDVLAIAGLWDALEDDPSPLTVTVSHEFRERRRDQREAVCRLLARLAQGVEIHVGATGVTERFLATKHRRDLPDVSEWCNRPHADTPTRAAVERARDRLDPEGTAVGILRRLADEPAHTLSYSGLYADPALPSNAAVRQHIGTLDDLALVARFGPDREKHVELLEAGRAYLAAIDATDTDSERVSDTGNSSPQAVLSREHAGGDGAADAADAPYRTAFLDRVGHAAAGGTATPGAVTLANGPESAADAGPDHVRYVSYHADRDEAVVAVRASGALQHMVSTALAFASPRLLTRVVTDARLDAVDEPPAILRDARCIGALDEDAPASAAVLRENLVEWRDRLADMTRKLRAEEYDDRDRFRQEILRSAHGLAGTVAHLFDVLGVDIVRELRVPSGLGDDGLESLARSVGVATAVQSRYGAFASYRQLFEERDRKRATAFSPTVDAADPTGALIGAYVVRGTDTHRLRPHLETALAAPAELHEDAPEFAVPVPIQEAGRQEIATTARRVCQRKRLGLTRSAVSLLAALVGCPYTVARALMHLGTEQVQRDLRPSDVRYALASVEPDRLLPDHAPTLGRVVAALLRADAPLTQTELADRAGVTPRSVRNHRNVLEAFDLVRIDDAGRYRLALSFNGDDEKHETVLPRPVTTDSRLTAVVSDALAALLSVEEYADPDGDVFQALTYPPDPWTLVDDPDLAPWLRLAAALVDADPPDREATVTMGPTVEQMPLPSSASDVDADTPTNPSLAAAGAEIRNEH